MIRDDDIALFETSLEMWRFVLETLSPALPSEPSTPELRGVMIEWPADDTARFSVYDGETGISFAFDASMEKTKISFADAMCVVDFDALTRIVEAFDDGDASAELALKEDGRVVMSADGITVPMRTYKDYPPVFCDYVPAISRAVLLDYHWAGTLAAAARCATSCIHISCTSDRRAVAVESLSQRLAFRASIPTLHEVSEEAFDFVVPAPVLAKTVGAFRRYGDGTVELSTFNSDMGEWWRIESGPVAVTVRPHAEAFPSLGEMLRRDAATATVVVNQAQLADLVGKCSKISAAASAGDEGVLMQVSSHRLLQVRPRVTSSDADLLCVAPLPAAAVTAGGTAPLVMPGAALSRALAVFATYESVALEVREGGLFPRPVLITAAEPGLLPVDTTAAVFPLSVHGD